ncbi:MAG: type II toxin-antitoxin system VapC family toxin [Acidimicrobiia bacterium]|nr:type II toxin-antitoxin system VapC family toxin [Acidimicrobiia bacterium]MDH4306380.1 type II toxin-antitoxin system VapC family toxin [Acidimicrobiia bacterium]MDH5292146.1 type II toxin-antitoxin system VapC family toxin [Acidimicrobiia bacterium]
MNVVDTSAIVAVLFDEGGGAEVEQRLLDGPSVMSAATRVELGIVIEAKKGSAGTQLLDELLARVGIEVVPVDGELAQEAIVAWRRFGNGRHQAGLNFGDVFSYALARRLGQPLLFVGDDFSHTDVNLP